MSFKCFFNSHFVFVSQIHISFLQGNSFRFAVIISLDSNLHIHKRIPNCDWFPNDMTSLRLDAN